MSTPGFLIDENLSPVLAIQLHQHEPGIQAFAVGEPSVPLKGTPDPQILYWIEANNCFLVTNNRVSMPGHLRDHIASGGHIPSIFVTPYPVEIGVLIEELTLIWGASLPDEYQDRIVYLPLTR